VSWRWAGYLALAAALVFGALLYNSAKRPAQVRRVELDPQVATSRGPHDHEKLGTACLCDPEAEIKQALRDRADYAATHIELGNRFRARGHYELAVERYKRALELEPANAEALFGLGLCYASLRRYAQAREALERAAEADRLFVNPYITLGLLDYREGKFAQAEKRWRAALRLDPKDEYAQMLLDSLPTVKRLSAGGGEKTAS